MKLGYLYGGKLRGSVDLGTDPYTGKLSTIKAPGGFIGPSGFGNFYYVDVENGDNDNDGESPENAVADINAANDLCTADKGDVIIFSSRLTSGNQFTEQQVINKRGIKLLGIGYILGLGGGYDSCFVTPHTCTGILDGDAHDFNCGLVLGADGIEVAGIKFYNPDATQAQFHIGLLDGQGDARGCSIHDNEFQGQLGGTADRTCGIKAVGIETLHIFRNHLYACETGIEICGGSERYSSENIIQDNIITKPKYGIHLSGGSTVENLIQHNSIFKKNVYGYTLSNCILIAAGANGNHFYQNKLGTTDADEAITDNGTANSFIDNYYEDAGGTKWGA